MILSKLSDIFKSKNIYGQTHRGIQIISTRPKDRRRETFKYIVILFLMIISIAVSVYALYRTDKINNIEQRLYKAEENILMFYKEMKNLQEQIKEIQKDKKDTLNSKQRQK